MNWATSLSPEGYFVVALLAIAAILFATEWVRPDLVALLTVVSLALSGIITTEQALAGFSSKAVIAIASLLVIGKSLVRTGVVRWIALRLKQLAGDSRRRLLLITTIAPGLLSGFINIVAAVSVFIPVVLRLARTGGLPAARLLMPMAFASLLGANLSLIGASHNLVVDTVVRETGLDGFGFFEFTPLGILLVISAVLYSLLLGGVLLPHSDAKDQARLDQGRPMKLTETYGLRDRLWQVWIKPDAPIVGNLLADLRITQEFGLTIASIMREESQHPVEHHAIRLQGDEVLLLIGRRERVEALVAHHRAVELLGPPEEDQPFPVSNADLVEVAVPARSKVIGKTLRELSLRQHTGLNAIALWRNGHPVRTDVSRYRLEAGDSLLLFGARTWVRSFQPAPDFLWLRPPAEEEAPLELRHLGVPAALIFLAILLVSASGWMTIAIATLIGAAAMVSLHIMRPQQAYQAIDWRTIVLIAGMLPMGTALRETGVADLLAQGIVHISGPLGPLAVLVCVAAVTMFLTQALHNAAVAVIMTPVALTCAELVHANPRGFAITVVVGASAKFLLPVGHPATLLVKAPGRYRTVDYLRFGIGLNALTLVLVALIVPWLWPLTATG